MTRVENPTHIDMLDRDGEHTHVPVDWCNWYKTPGEYYMWMAAELFYDIKVTLAVSALSESSERLDRADPHWIR